MKEGLCTTQSCQIDVSQLNSFSYHTQDSFFFGIGRGAHFRRGCSFHILVTGDKVYIYIYIYIYEFIYIYIYIYIYILVKKREF